MKYKVFQGDCLDVMKTWKDKSVDLVVGSPPYEDKRTYQELEFDLEGEDYVAWFIERFKEMLRVSKGLVAMVIDGKTEAYRYSSIPELIRADLHRSGVTLRRSPLYVRWGVAGSGGPDWFRNRYETIICASHAGRLPYAVPTATGKPPKYGPGGNPSARGRTGRRQRGKAYKPPTTANPGNLFDCGADTHLGAGNDGDAPFPVAIPLAFVKSFCPPGGIVADPFCGTGTTGEAALSTGRRFIGIDARASEIIKTEKRLKRVLANPGLGLL